MIALQSDRAVVECLRSLEMLRVEFVWCDGEFACLVDMLSLNDNSRQPD